MNRNEMQARWLVSQGWLQESALPSLAAELQHAPLIDLCTLLVQRGLLDEPRAREARLHAERALGLQRAADSDRTPLVYPNHGPVAGSPAGHAPPPGGFVAPPGPPSGGFPAVGSGERGGLRRPSGDVQPYPAPGSGERGGLRRPSGEVQPYPGSGERGGLRRPSGELRHSKASHEVPAFAFDSGEQAPLSPPVELPGAQRLDARRRFGPYEILDELGRGAMGVVFHAVHRDTGDEVALKVMLDEEPRADDIERFRREVDALVRLKHRHVVEILDSGQEGRHLFYAMAFIRGETLTGRISRALQKAGRAPGWEESVSLLAGIADALAHCHEHGILHRDVKPHNILIERNAEDRSSRAILADFGLMKQAPPEDGESDGSGRYVLTRTGEIIGTPAFMAPEQAKPDGPFGALGRPADVWGFAMTLFFCITGTTPYALETIVEAVNALLTKPVPRLQALRSDVPDWLDELMAECLEKESDLRPDMAEVAARLRRGLRSGETPRRLPVSRAGLVLIPALVVGILAVLGWGWLRPDPLRLIELKAVATLTGKDRTTIRGRVNHPGTKLRIGDTTSTADDEGWFEAEVLLSREGTQSFYVRIPSEPAREVKIDITRDTAAPKFLFEPPLRAKGEYVVGADEKIRGILNDEHRSHVAFDGERFKVGRDGSFAIALPQGAQRIVLVGVDQAGNETTAALRPVTRDELRRREAEARAEAERKQRALEAEQALEAEARAKEAAEQRRIEEERRRLEESSGRVFSEKELAYIEASKETAAAEARAWLKARGDSRGYRTLSSILAWSQAKPEVQDEAVREVTKRLGESWRHLETLTRVVEPWGLRTATFEHKPTGLRFQLVPGALHQSVWWANPEVAFVHGMLSTLAGSWSGLAYVAAVFETPPYRGFNKQVCDAFKLRYDPVMDDDRSSDDFSTESEKMAWVQKKKAAIKRTLDHFVDNRKDLERLRKLARGWSEYYRKTYPSLVRWEYMPPMLLGQTEVSQDAWDRFGDKTVGREHDVGPTLPIHDLSERQVRDWLREVGDGLRLPTRNEWGFAWRGAMPTPFFWGRNHKGSSRYIWNVYNSAGLKPVTAHLDATNMLGFADMAGNVQEWVEPRWSVWKKARDRALELRGQSLAKADVGKWQDYPRAGVIIGGSRSWHPYGCRPELFRVVPDGEARFYTGFRAARDLP